MIQLNTQEINNITYYKKRLRVPYPLKSNYEPVIPLNIYQTWHTKNLPEKMSNTINLIKNLNPRFSYQLFDDNDCREFIKNNFENNILHAFDSLIPGAYKADLWRYCVLYIHGGIYLDIKLNCINGFKLIELTEKNHYVKDRIGVLSIYNALMACQKGSPLLWKAIYKVVMNVSKRFYGSNPLEPTGPLMLGSIVLKNNLLDKVDMRFHKDGKHIIYKNRFIISTEYPEYRQEQENSFNSLNTKRYWQLWDERNIYR
jgi:mannosyltransferase OCH1-like enzyme